jgi:hypothetical protein
MDVSSKEYLIKNNKKLLLLIRKINDLDITELSDIDLNELSKEELYIIINSYMNALNNNIKFMEKFI